MTTPENAPSPPLDDVSWLMRAIELSRSCPKAPGSYAVGAILVDASGRELSSGYSLEQGPGFHAEETAIAKAQGQGLELLGCTVFSSLEPCSVRRSGKRSCVEHIVRAGVRRVVFALYEPPLFVRCEGAKVLREQGVEVMCLPELAALVEEVNAHLLANRPATS